MFGTTLKKNNVRSDAQIKEIEKLYKDNEY